jgi:hypothetical protein
MTYERQLSNDHSPRSVAASFEAVPHAEQVQMPTGLSIEVVYWSHADQEAAAESAGFIADADVFSIEGMDMTDESLRALQQIADAPVPTKEKRYIRDKEWVESQVKRHGHEIITPFALALWGTKKQVDSIDVNLDTTGHMGYNMDSFFDLMKTIYSPESYNQLPTAEAKAAIRANFAAFGNFQRGREEQVAANLVEKLPSYADPNGAPRNLRIFFAYTHATLAAEIGRYGLPVGEQQPEGSFTMRPQDELIMRYRMGQEPDEQVVAQALLGVMVSDIVHYTLANRAGINTGNEQFVYEARILRAFNLDEAQECFEDIQRTGKLERFSELQRVKGLPLPSDPGVKAYIGR